MAIDGSHMAKRWAKRMGSVNEGSHDDSDLRPITHETQGFEGFGRMRARVDAIGAHGCDSMRLRWPVAVFAQPPPPFGPLRSGLASTSLSENFERKLFWPPAAQQRAETGYLAGLAGFCVFGAELGTGSGSAGS